METIIKYNRPKNSKGRESNVSVYNIGGSSISSDTNIDIESSLLWKKSVGTNSLVPKSSVNQAEGLNSVAIGQSTQTSNDGELAIGTFNITESGETLFTIGNGTDDVNRSNLISIGKSNTIVNNNIIESKYMMTNY